MFRCRLTIHYVCPDIFISGQTCRITCLEHVQVPDWLRVRESYLTSPVLRVMRHEALQARHPHRRRSRKHPPSPLQLPYREGLRRMDPPVCPLLRPAPSARPRRHRDYYFPHSSCRRPEGYGVDPEPGAAVIDLSVSRGAGDGSAGPIQGGACLEATAIARRADPRGSAACVRATRGPRKARRGPDVWQWPATLRSPVRPREGSGPRTSRTDGARWQRWKGSHHPDSPQDRAAGCSVSRCPRRHQQARRLPHLPALLRHAPAGVGLRHPLRAGAAGPLPCEDHADLHACPEPRRQRHPQPARRPHLARLSLNSRDFGMRLRQPLIGVRLLAPCPVYRDNPPSFSLQLSPDSQNQMSDQLTAAEAALREAALDYHRLPTPGKVAVSPTKPLVNQRDLSLAYSPGVAYPCLDIAADPKAAALYTSRGNLVGVVTNGTAVLGLGDIGPLAAKPVMEGKGCLFKKFAGIDVFDIELAERDPDRLVDMIAALEPTLGGVNLEDIKAPECFYVERKLTERMGIPVFHDDQHGTAIISAAAIRNGLELVGKDIGKVKVVVSGAGAAAIACLDLMVGLGLKRENVFACDSKGLIYEGRGDSFNPEKARYAQRSDLRTLGQVIPGADVFLGCSTGGVLLPDMVKQMAARPIILALANPEPEIRPELALAARPDCIIATGRSDYANQVNNVLCFPYIFRGALDCGATKITDAMKLACVKEIADLAKAEISDEVASAYPGQELAFGTDYIIPKPFDSRLIIRIAPAVAAAAAASGVATRPIADMDAYRAQLTRMFSTSGMLTRPVFSAAKASTRK